MTSLSDTTDRRPGVDVRGPCLCTCRLCTCRLCTYRLCTCHLCEIDLFPHSRCGRGADVPFLAAVRVVPVRFRHRHRLFSVFSCRRMTDSCHAVRSGSFGHPDLGLDPDLD